MISWLALHLELSLALFQVRAELEARRCMGHYGQFYRPVSRGKREALQDFPKAWAPGQRLGLSERWF